MKRMRRRVVIGLLLALLFFLLTELRARGRRSELLAETIDELRSQCGQSGALLAEYHQLNADVTPAGYIVQKDFAGRFYNFRGGERLVVNAVTGAPYTIWIFGNSGTMDLYLADYDTFALHLQSYFKLYRVRNRSAWSQAIVGQLAWLRETPIRPGDLVLFIDGFMDRDTPTAIPPVIAQAEAFTLARGAGFWHFRQPMRFPMDTPGIPINLADDLFVEYAHLNERGTIIEARQIYDQLSIY